MHTKYLSVLYLVVSETCQVNVVYVALFSLCLSLPSLSVSLSPLSLCLSLLSFSLSSLFLSLSLSLSSLCLSLSLSLLASEEATVVTVPQPDLSGATEQMNAEAVQHRLDQKAAELRNDPSLTDVEREMILKEEKMRIGIEKMKIAHKRRVAIKFFNPDRSNKTVVVEEGMTSSMVCHLLVNKNHFDESPNWVIVEQLGDVSLERELEDHECIVTVYSSWPRDHNNVFLFKQNEKKYDLFEDPIVSSLVCYN